MQVSGILVLCCGPGGTALWRKYLGGQPPIGQGPGGVSYPGCETANRTSSGEDTGREAEIHLGGGRKVGSGIIDNGGVYQAAEEHVHAVHHYAITVRPM